MNWNEFVKTLIDQKVEVDDAVKKDECKSPLFSRDKQRIEKSIVWRLNAIFGNNWKLKNGLSTYYIPKPIKTDKSDEEIDDRDVTNCCTLTDDTENNLNTNDPRSVDIARVAAVFWQFVENALNHSKIEKDQLKSTKKFLLELNNNPFESEEERSKYIETFCSEHNCLDSYYFKYYLKHDYFKVPKNLKKRSRDIKALKKNKLIESIYDTYYECLSDFDSENYLQRFGNERLFENASDQEMEFYKFLLNNFPRYEKGHYGNFSTIDAIKTHHWEKFDIGIRKKLAEYIETLSEADNRICRYVNLNYDEDVESAVDSLKLRILYPEQGLIFDDVHFIIELLHKDPEQVEQELGSYCLQNFYADLHRILIKNFPSQMNNIDDIFAGESDIIPYEEQLNSIIAEPIKTNQ